MATQNPDDIVTGKSVPSSIWVWISCLTILHVVAVVSSISRVHRRRKIRRLWWDDYFAIISVVFDIIFFPTLWLSTLGGDPSMNEQLTIRSQILTSWISETVYLLLLWCTRISLALSIARVIPPQSLMRKAAIMLSITSGVIGLGLLAHISIFCGAISKTWAQSPPYRCPVTPKVAIARTLCDMTTDIALIVVPFLAFWRQLKLPRVARRLIKACFAASVLTMLATVSRAVMLLPPNHSTSVAEWNTTAFKGLMMSHLVGTISLIVCNLLVVATSLYRFFRPEPWVTAIGESKSLPPLRNITDANPRNTSQISSSQRSPAHANTASQLTGNLSSSYHVELTELFEEDFTPTPSSNCYPLDPERNSSCSGSSYG